MTGTVLITGAAGFIGSHVAEALLHRGRRVVGVDNFDPFYDEGLKRGNVRAIERAAEDPSPVAARHPLPGGRGEGFEAARGRGGFVLVEADICDAPAMRRVFAEHRPETVVHLAARAGVRPSIADPMGYARVNVEGTASVFEAARLAGCTRALMASSSSVYGNASVVPFSEEDTALAPISPYAATKRACEMLAHTYHHLYAMRIACLRFFTAYGPRQRPDLAIMSFMKKMRAGEAIPVFGDGSMSRDFTYIDDIVAGVLASEDAIDRHGLRAWNLGGNHPVSVREMVAEIARVTGIEAKIDRRPEQPGDVRRTCADVSRSRAELGFEAKTAFAEGLARQWEWLRNGK